MEPGKVFSTVEEADELSSAMVCPEIIVTTNTLVPECFSYAQLANLAVKRKEMCHSFRGADITSCSKTESSVSLSSEQVITKAEYMLPFKKCFRLIAASSTCNLGGDCSNRSSSNAVIVSLKRYDSQGNSQHGKCSFQLSMNSEPLPQVLVNVLPVIKSSYNTYVPLQKSQSIDCKNHISKSAPCHSHVAALIEHVLEPNHALVFCNNMKLLKHACASYNANTKNKRAFPAKPPSVIDSQICSKFMGCYIIKTPLWVIQHCLSQVKGVGKTYLVHISDARELAAAADGAFVICGLVNPNCAQRSDHGKTPEYPYDLACSFVSPKSQQNKIPPVVLYFPSMGTYYLPWYIADTSCL